MATAEWRVNSKTKTTYEYVVDNKVVATIAGLKAGLKTGTTIAGITVNEGSNGATGTITLDSRVLDGKKVSLSLSNGGKYELGLSGGDVEVTCSNVVKSYTTNTKKGATLTVKGDLSAGYVLKDAKTITYSQAAAGSTLTTISGLSNNLTLDGDKLVATTDDTTDPPTTADAVTFDDATGIVTLTEHAVDGKSVTLTVNNATHSPYSALTLDGSVAAPTFEGDWVYSKGNAVFQGTVSEAGYRLSLDGKTLIYSAESTKTANLVTVSGLVVPTDGDITEFLTDVSTTTVSSTNNPTITLPASVLTNKNVTVTNGYLLALNDSGDDVVPTSTVAEKNTWAVSKTTATYKHVKPAYYTYDSSTNTVVYTAEANLKTLATLKGLKSGLEVTDKGTEGDDTLAGVSVEGNTITLTGGADADGANVNEDGSLGTSSVTLTNGTGESYKLALNNVTAPASADEVWAVSGTTATLKGTTTAGYALTDDTTITYVKNSGTKLVNLATVKGLKSGTTLGKTGTVYEGKVGIAGKDSDGNYFLTEGLSENDGSITVSANVLGTSDVTLTPTAGFSYSLALDDGTGTGGAVNTSDSTGKTFWYIQGKKLLLKDGTARYYALSTDGQTITEYDEVVGKDVATVTGLTTSGLKVVDGDIDGIEVSGNFITVGKDVLPFTAGSVTVANSNGGNYKFKLNANDNLTQQDGTYWDIDGTMAILSECTTAGYSGDGTTTLTYNTRNPGETLATITGLKSGLKVNKDDTITGIEISGISESGDESDPTAEKTITLSKNVLGTTDVEIDAMGLSYGYSLALDEATGTAAPVANVTPGWRTEGKNVGKNGTAYYDVTTTTAGFNPETTEIDSTEVVNKLSYHAKGTVTTTITGLSFDTSNSNITNTGEGYITGPDEDGVFTVSLPALNDKDVKLTNAKGGTYTLALNKTNRTDETNYVPAPTVSTYTWVPDAKTKTKATLTGDVADGKEGYSLSEDATYIAYTPAGDGVTLATVSGLKSGLTADELNSGIDRNGNELVLSNSVLGGTKLTVSGGNYTLGLADEVLKEATSTTNWVTSGTTATYKTYMSGYYTPDAKGTTVNYTKPTAGTTFATLKGIKSGATIAESQLNGSTTGGTLTLTGDQLGTSKITLTGATGTKFYLALDSGVLQKANTALEWVVNGTTATYTNHVQTYYTLSGNTITYHAPTKGTVRATVSGIKSGLENFSQYVDSNTGVITLGEDQLAQKKVTLTGDGYTLALGDISDENLATTQGYYWIQAKNAVKADYKENVSKGYALSSDSKTITYSGKATDVVLATVNGITKNETGEVIDTRTAIEEEVNGKTVITGYTYPSTTDLTGSGITVDNETKTITVTGNDFTKQSDDTVKNGAKVTLATKYDYKLGALTAPVQEDEPEWRVVVDKKGNPNGQLVYQQGYTAGHTLSADAKTLTYSAETATTLATISGLDKTALADLSYDQNDYTISADDLEDSGITVNESTFKLTTDELLAQGKITLGKNDAYVLDASALAPTSDGTKWTLKGTTATYSETLTDGYKQTDTKNVVYTKAATGDAIVTISGLKKGLKVGEDSNGKSIVGVVDSTTKTVTTAGITMNDTAHRVTLKKEVLGTTDITLTDNSGLGYKITSQGGNAPVLNPEEWIYSKGTATYRQVQNSGYTLATDGLSVAYTAPKTTTLATVKGLNKTFTGNLDSAITTSGETITVNEGLLTTGNVTLTLPKNPTTTYSLAIGSGVAQQANSVTEWVTSGTNANYKTYEKAYYTIDPNSGAIVYHKPTSGTTYATIKGIKSGVDINSASAVSTDGSGGTVTLTAAMLGTSSVSVSVPKNNSSAVYTLAIAGDVPTSTANVTEWVTAKGTATYRNYNKGSYEYNSTKNQIVYTAGSNPKGSITDYATVKGVTSDLTATYNNGVFAISSSEIGNNVSVSGTDEDHNSFSFGSTYNNSAINGSANVDNITANGDGLTINTGKGNDTITLGTGSRAGNTIVYTNGDGADTIVNFQAGDNIQIKKGFVAANYIGGTTIEVGTGSIELQGYTGDYITINNVKYAISGGGTYNVASNVLLADDNYSMNAASLSEIVQPDSASFTPYDFDGGFSLTKEDKLTPQVSYSGKDK